MKNNGSVRKKGFIKRLAQESLILSCLGKISSRLIYFFKVSMLSFFLTGCEGSDKALENGVAGSYAREHKLVRRFTRPVKTAFASSVEDSFFAGLYRKAVRRVLYTPVSTFGAFFLTFGIYIALVYYVRLYGFDVTTDAASLEIAFVTVLFSLPLILSRKSLVKLLDGSVFINGLFSGCIDFSRYDGEKLSGAVGTAIIAGSVSGVLSFFCGEVRMLIFLFAAVYMLVVFHSPELGLFSTALAYPFFNRAFISALVLMTFFSYVIKVLRGKRNLHFGAAGIFVSIVGTMFLFAWIGGGGERALFAFCMCALYVLGANLLSTPRLLKKCVSSFVSGFGICLLVASVQTFNSAWLGEGWRTVLDSCFSVFDSSGALAGYMLLMLPFVFCKANRSSFLAKGLSYLLFVGCIAYSVFTGHTFFALLAAGCVTVYLAISSRRIFRPLVLCFGVPVAGLYFAAVPISYSGMGLYGIMANWTATAAAASSTPVFGVGMSEASLALAYGGETGSMFLQIFLECGLSGILLLILALAFAFQRLYARLSKVGTENRVITAAAGATALSGLVLGCGMDLWSHTELCVVFWLSLALADATYRIRKEERRETDEH